MQQQQQQLTVYGILASCSKILKKLGLFFFGWDVKGIFRDNKVSFANGGRM